MEPVVRVIKKILPAVVSITASKYLTVFESPLGPFSQGFVVPKGRKKMEVGGGSGFIIDPSGIVLTNRHVVADSSAEYVVIASDDKKYEVEILARDPINDVAILKIKGKKLPIVELGDSSKLELGQTVIAVGNALGRFRNTVSTGVVSGLSRYITAFSGFDHRAQRLRGLIQTDAAINPGNSGGPLVDLSGKAIGINAATVFLAENIGFALPINTAKKDLEDLKKYKRIRQPFLGVRHIILNEDLKEQYNLPMDRGALIISEPPPSPFEQREPAVMPGSAAEKAGLKEGDIVLEVEKEKITPENLLEDLLQKYKIGQTITLKILRDGKELMLKTALEEKK
jgi:S1-C subfamily serine protease